MNNFTKTLIAAGAVVMMSAPVFANSLTRDFKKSDGSFNQFSSGYRQPEALNPAYVRQVQASLRDQGFYNGKVDGQWGHNTTAAIRDYQSAHGMEPTGTLTETSMRDMGININQVTYDDSGHALPTRAGARLSTETVRDNMMSNEH